MSKKDLYKKKRIDAIEGIKQMFTNGLDYLFNFYWFIDLLSFFIKKDEDPLKTLAEEEYREIFIKGRSKEDIKFSYQQAWSAKNFEIELYWKRAQYFWAFQIAAFAGYFAVLNSSSYSAELPKNPEVLFVVICIGFITAIAWNFINQGSKTWQRHWEIHVDMLENELTGPLYKIVTTQKTFSVSKINDIVSRFFALIWIIMGIKYFIDHLNLNPLNIKNINWLIVIALCITVYFLGAMYMGHGRGRFGERVVKFYKRKIK